jgi:CheY-like chemotaxis protein
MAKTILVVDDQPEIVELVERILELEGYQVVTSPNGNALQHLQNPLPDLILLDVFLPDGDGRTFCSQVKKQATTRHIPVLLFSAHLHIRDQHTCSRGGYVFGHFLLAEKPAL